MLQNQPAVELGEVCRLDGGSLTHADAGRQAVDGRAAGEGGLDDRPSGLHAHGNVGGELDTCAASCDREHVVE